jgi:transcriptional regulator with XRE-family HTH domain
MMNTNTTFKTAAEAAAFLAKKPEIASAVEQDIENSRLVTLLVDMRMAKNITQDQVAQSMRCDPSKISRMESCSDSYLRLNDIIGYTNALGVQVSVMFDDNSLPASARIKQCVMQIDRDLKKLLHIAQQQDGNQEITSKIGNFYQEVLFNFLVKYTENNVRLRNFIPLNQPSPDDADIKDEDESPCPDKLEAPTQ